MDKIDKQILNELQKNSSIPLSELSKKVGLSSTPCWNRIKKLEEDKIIKSRTIVLDNKKVNLPITVFLSISIQNHTEVWLKNFQRVVQKYDEILEIRGAGFLLGIKTKRKNTEVIQAISKNKLLLIAASENIIRVAPPLIVTKKEIDNGIFIIEKTLKHVLKNVYAIEVKTPFNRLTYHDSINLYGTDKPDLRISNTIQNFTEIFINTDISFIKETIASKGTVRGFIINELFTRSKIDSLDEMLKVEGSQGLGWFKVENNEISGPLTKILNDDEITEISKNDNCTILFQAGKTNETAHYLDILRREIYEIENNNKYEFVWIDDFPYFEYDEGKLQPSHHPFTSPKDVNKFIKNPEKATALHYDLVLNGVELGSGSQRINNPKLQHDVLSKWGLSDHEIIERFGWFIEALSYGSPQHAGFAVGIDRLIAEMLNAESIRDVIPFPKTQSGMDPLTDAPSSLTHEELMEYNLYIDGENDE